MQFSFPIFAVVLLLGILQLAVGVVFGRYLVIGGTPPNGVGQNEVKRLRFLAGRFRDLIVRVAEDVDDHHAQIEKVNRQLASAQTAEGENLADFVLKSVNHIMQINERLNTRLKVTEGKLQEQTEQIEAHLIEARTDSLTALPNRRMFDDALTRQFADFRRSDVPFCLLMIDIDHFKRLNDCDGHAAGDHVLRRVAEVLRRTLPEPVVVARLGGEEFAAILAGLDLSDARSAAELYRRAVATEEFVFGGKRLRTTISLGLARVQNGEDATSLAARADEALYAAKRNGRNRAYFHNGRQCEAIASEASDTAADATNPPRSGPIDPAELAAICGDLRTRVTELAQ